MGKRFVLTLFGALAMAVPLYAQTSGHSFGTGSSASGASPPIASPGEHAASSGATSSQPRPFRFQIAVPIHGAARGAPREAAHEAVRCS